MTQPTSPSTTSPSQPMPLNAALEQSERDGIVGSLEQIFKNLRSGRSFQDDIDIIVDVEDKSHRSPPWVDGSVRLELKRPLGQIHINYRIRDEGITFTIETIGGKRFAHQGLIDSKDASVAYLSAILSYMRQYLKPMEKHLEGEQWIGLRSEMVREITNLSEGRQDCNGVRVIVTRGLTGQSDSAFTKRVVIHAFGSPRVTIHIHGTDTLSVYFHAPKEHLVVDPLVTSTRLCPSDYQEIMEYLRAYERATIRSGVRMQASAQIPPQ